MPTAKKGSRRAGAKPKKKTAAEKAASRNTALEVQLRMLEWRKLQNESSIRTIVDRSRIVEREERTALDSPEHQASSSSRHERWMRGVMEDEMQRPLQIGREYVASYRTRQHRQRRQDHDDARRHQHHISTLQRAIDRNEELARRHEVYKSKKQAALSKYALVQTKRAIADDSARGAVGAAGTAAPR